MRRCVEPFLSLTPALFVMRVSQINEPVLRVMEYHYEKGGGMCQLPNKFDEPLPPAPHNFMSLSDMEKLRYRDRLNSIRLFNRVNTDCRARTSCIRGRD
jgi:hypothetical protein